MKAPIHSIKHFIHTPAQVIVSGARINLNLVVGTVAPAATLATDVTQGALVKAIYVEYWVSGVTAAKTVLGAIIKLPAGNVGPSFAESVNLGSYGNKKNIFETHQGLVPTEGNQMALFRHWIRIPKGKQRIGLGDKIVILVSATGTNVNLCGFATFKEYV